MESKKKVLPKTFPLHLILLKDFRNGIADFYALMFIIQLCYSSFFQLNLFFPY